jgi:hypothetical protein
MISKTVKKTSRRFKRWGQWVVSIALLSLSFEILAFNLPDYIWISPEQIAQLPTTGVPWSNLKKHADKPLSKPNLSDQNDKTNVRVLAKALVYVRTSQPGYRRAVIRACMEAIDTENDGTTLAFGRELMAYVIAAQLVKLPEKEEQRFAAWLKLALDKNLKGRTLRSTHQKRANNWGTHAGASRAAVAIYLKDAAELKRTALVFRGWLGETQYYNDFKYKHTDRWQANPQRPVGINPQGATKAGHNVDGVLPEEQRRSGPFCWPPPKEGYVWEVLQGAIALAVILDRAGYKPFDWSDKALLRAYKWLYEQAKFPAKGDDTWQPHLVNYYYHTAFAAPVPAKGGKNIGWTDWTHGSQAIINRAKQK